MIHIRPSLFAAVALSGLALAPLSQPQAALPASLLTIQANAQAAKGNAAHYQWKRVNWEVDRIIAAEHQWEQTQTSEASAGLRAAVLSLRTARASHDSLDAVKAAQEVSAQCALLDK